MTTSRSHQIMDLGS